MFERFNADARQVVVHAPEQARELHHDFVGTEHLLLGIARHGGGVGGQVLDALGLRLEVVRNAVVQEIGWYDRYVEGLIPFTQRAKDCLGLALRASLRLGHEYVGSEHLLLGLIDDGDGLAARILAAGPGLATVRDQVLASLRAFEPPAR
jgi:ATP-dependent Clp protease ATP-binding subunit ClpC